MAGSPQLKVFSPDGEYIGSCKYAEDAINMAQFRGNGAEVRHGHSKQMVIWRVSDEDDLTGDGEDIIDANLLWQRVDEIWDNVPKDGSRKNTYQYTPRERK